MNISNLFSNDKQNIFILISIWIGLIFIINPIGDFPLNDDWSYAKPVQSLLNGEGIKFTGWMSMTLFSQVVWGALWCKIFGFSFTVLRFSTLFLGGFGVIYSYKLLSQFLISSQMVFLFTLLVLFNPIYLNLSYTFMTDVPFYAFSVISIYYFVNYLDQKENKNLLIGLLFSLVAILTRQLALVIPLAFLLVGCFDFFKTKKFNFKYLLPFIISSLVYFIYQLVAHKYFDARGRYDEMNGKLFNQIISSPLSWLMGVFNRGVIGLLYLTLFISPLLLGLFTKSNDKATWGSIILGSFFMLFLYSNDLVLPILDNLIYNFGLGPATLYDSWFAGLEHLNQINANIWIIISILVCILFIYLIIRLGKLDYKIDLKTIFLIVILTGYIILICSIYTFDRYYILPVILLISILSSIINIEIYKPAFSVLLVIMIWFSVAGTQDYMSWNKARWSAINSLIKVKKLNFDKIDGGFEFNGLYNYNEVDQPNGLRNLWVHNVDYIIAFNQLDGTDIDFEKEYFSLLWMKTKSIKVLKKNYDFKDMEEPYFMLSN